MLDLRVDQISTDDFAGFSDWLTSQAAPKAESSSSEQQRDT